MSKGLNVDAETRAELSEIKSDLHLTIINTISEGFKGLRADLTEFFNKDFDSVKKDFDNVHKRLDHFQSNHVEHYDDDKERRLEIAKLKEYTDGELHKLKEMVLEETISEKTKDKLEEKNDRNKNTNIALVVALFTVVPGVIGAIIYLASRLPPPV